MSVHKVEVKPGEEPNKWKVVKVADVGGDEESTKQMLELCSLLEAGVIEGPRRAAVKHAIVSTLMDGLMPAFLELEHIRSTTGKAIPLMNREQMFGDFARKLWKSYKELMQQTAELIGFDIGFLFQREKEFREGLVILRAQHPILRDWFEKFLEDARDNWQNDLCKFRNTWVEHQRGERRNFDRFYKPKYAERVFSDAWNTIVTILAAMLETHLPFGGRLLEQDENDPGPKWPNRFRYQHPTFQGMK
jgi:hypothetical protein